MYISRFLHLVYIQFKLIAIMCLIMDMLSVIIEKVIHTYYATHQLCSFLSPEPLSLWWFIHTSKGQRTTLDTSCILTFLTCYTKPSSIDKHWNNGETAKLLVTRLEPRIVWATVFTELHSLLHNYCKISENTYIVLYLLPLPLHC